MRPWAGFRIAKFVWIGVATLILAFAPILFSDLVIMIPLSMAFLFAGGPVFAHAAQPPTCPSCGLARPHPGWHETPCRPVRAVATEPSALRVHATPAPENDEVSGLRTLPQRPPQSG